ncbi:MAG: exopolysaccharide biosynthesis polyprenyl glycosylphosphotransferase [Bacteroidetes bacterium]|nr:exopolysaccharide biosynthesis polyprenyl glycosylphosphotransferase [Bacteroidota bacterium]
MSIFLSTVLTTGNSDETNASNKVYLFIFSNLAWLFLTMVSNPYNLSKGWSVSKVIKSQLAFIFIHLLVVAALIFFLKRSYSTLQIGLMYLIFVTMFFSWKMVIYYMRKILTPAVSFKNYILVGNNSISKEIRKYYLLNPQLGYKFKGYFSIDETEALVEKIRVFSETNEIHEIYCCSSGQDYSLKQLINLGLDSLIRVKIVTDFNESLQRAIQLDRFDREPISSVTIPIDESRNQFIKRLFDIVFSSLFLIFIMSWLLPIIALLIKLDSKGPVFFRQLRSGKNNRPFKCFKFRTMVINSKSDTHQASKNDTRVTKLGAILRKTSIDELPQFINVFLGNMSIVGPRPHMLKHTEEYRKLIEEFMGRHYVKPGITGLAQCLGYRGEIRDITDIRNRVRMDRYYIENWSFFLDLKVIYITIISLLRGSEKAY